MSAVPGLVLSKKDGLYADVDVTCWACGDVVVYEQQMAHTCWGPDHPVIKRLAAIEARLPKVPGDA